MTLPDPIILQAPVGSTVHGLHITGEDDRDEMGIYLNSHAATLGFDPGPETIVERTATTRTGRADARSEPGDLDLVLHSLRKFLRLALAGNPTILMLLFAKEDVVMDARGSQLLELTPDIVSRQAGPKFVGYLKKQRERLIGDRGRMRVNRPELIAKYGYDTKYAMHMLRLGYQGVELLETGHLALPMPEPSRTFLREVRQGHIKLQDALHLADTLTKRIEKLQDSSPLPLTPDSAKVQDWMLAVYLEHWKAHAFDRKVAQHVENQGSQGQAPRDPQGEPAETSRHF